MQRKEPEAPSAAACLNCGSTDTDHWTWAQDVEYQTSDERYEYLRCGACGVVFIADPPIHRLHEIYPSNYYSFQGGDPSALERAKAVLDRRAMKKVTASIPGSTLRVLDVGGGVGFMADTARQADGRIVESVVVDLDEACRHEAERRGHTFVCSRIEDFATDSATFDLILAFNLIEHVRSPREVLAAFRTLLSPGGRVIVKTPNIDAWDARLFRDRSWGGLHCPRHWVLFDEDSFRGSARAAELAVERLEYTQGAPFWAVSLVHELESRGRLERPQGTALVDTTAYKIALAATAPLEVARSKVAKTSQMFAVLRHGDDAR